MIYPEIPSETALFKLEWELYHKKGNPNYFFYDKCLKRTDLIICPIKQDASTCQSHTAYRIDARLRKNQNGFRPGRSASAQMLALRRLVEECKLRHKHELTILFIDFKKAFDSVSRE